MWYLTHFISKILSESDNIYIVWRINKNMNVTVWKFSLFINFLTNSDFSEIFLLSEFSSKQFEILTSRMRGFFVFFVGIVILRIFWQFSSSVSGFFSHDNTSRQKPILKSNWSNNNGWFVKIKFVLTRCCYSQMNI